MAQESGRPADGMRELRRILLLPAEVIFTRLAGSRPLAGSRGTFLIAFRRYVGTPLDLPDGTRIQRGDRLCEIHFWNRRIAERQASTAGTATWGVIRDFRADLGTLAGAVASGALGEVRAIYAASPLAPAAAHFGFFVRQLPAGWRRSLLTVWQTGLRRAFRPKALHTEISAPTAELWMSATQLVRRYERRAAMSEPIPHGLGRSSEPHRSRNA